jgi:Asp-tRNA(Asn)/Glu-tRNA(Gln) amidotransferase C subunit
MKTKGRTKISQSPSRSEKVDTIDDVEDLHTRLVKGRDDVDSILSDLVERVDERDGGGRVETTTVKQTRKDSQTEGNRGTDLVGSSRKKRAGSFMSSMPIETRFFCPPEIPFTEGDPNGERKGQKR